MSKKEWLLLDGEVIILVIGTSEVPSLTRNSEGNVVGHIALFLHIFVGVVALAFVVAVNTEGATDHASREQIEAIQIPTLSLVSHLQTGIQFGIIKKSGQMF